MQFALDGFKRYGQLDAPVVVFVPFARDEIFEAVGDSPSTMVNMLAKDFTERMRKIHLLLSIASSADIVKEKPVPGFVQDCNFIPLVLRPTNHLEKVQAICGSGLMGLFLIEIVIRVGLYSWLAGCMQSNIESSILLTAVLSKPRDKTRVEHRGRQMSSFIDRCWGSIR